MKSGSNGDIPTSDWLERFEEGASVYLEVLRQRVDARRGNIAAIALGEVEYHLRALERVLVRYAVLSGEFVDTQQALRDSNWGEGKPDLADQVAEWLERSKGRPLRSPH